MQKTPNLTFVQTSCVLAYGETNVNLELIAYGALKNITLPPNDTRHNP